jgi:predicted  nucleic acid-binding Zn-ribbon protein
MTDSATVASPLEVLAIEISPADAGSVRLRLTGRWVHPARAVEEELLVVQIDGRRHRFPVSRELDAADSGAWSATVTLPAWAEPRYDGQAALWLGNSVIPVPPPASRAAPAARPARPGSKKSRARAKAAPAPEPVPLPQVSPPVDEAPEPRSGPLADLLLKETVGALHAELEQRAAELARLRGALADAQSELEARDAMRAALETAHEQLRAELERLTSGVERHRGELDERATRFDHEREELTRRLTEMTAARDQRSGEATTLREQLTHAQAVAERRAAEAVRLREDLAAANVARDAAVGEVAGLRAELERLGTELAATRERVGAESGDLGEAQQLLADARALADQLRERN